MPTSKKVGILQPHELSLIIGVSPLSISIDGWADGVFLNARQLTPNINSLQGASGEIGVILAISTIFELDITLLQTSKNNTIISSLHLATIKSGATYPVSFDDANGDTVGVGGTGVFTQFPDQGWDKSTVQPRVWTLQVYHMEWIVGGNDA